MKNQILTLIAVFFIALPKQLFSQTINWGSFKDTQKHLLNLHTGWDYGLGYGLAYGYKLNTKMPIVLGAEYAFPSGENVFDDFKTKLGGQINLCQKNHLRVTANIQGIFRRYENPLVRLQNFGTEIIGVAGYYRPRGFVAGEVGFDKAIVTHFKHSDLFKENNYAEIKDRWLVPTGGNFHYGLQAGLSLKKGDIILKIGKLTTQDFSKTPMIPYYLQLGINLKINKRNM
jgi:hypothetical protein